MANGPSLMLSSRGQTPSSKVRRKKTASGGSWHLSVKLAFRAWINGVRVGSALHRGQRLLVGVEYIHDNDQLDGGALAVFLIWPSILRLF